MDLSLFFNPNSIAIVGASHEKNKVGHLVAKNLIEQGYKGKIFLINNKFKGKILGKKVYSSLSEGKEKIDLVVFAVPATYIFPLIDEAANLNIKNVVIYAAGFKETGEEGKNLENNLKERISAYKMNLLGPNCIGYVNTAKSINLTFLKNTVPSGNIGFISQSGALGSALTDYFLAHKNLGFSHFISLGNKAIINEADCLEFLANDKKTEVIAMYLEDVKDGEKFKKALYNVSRKKPVIIIKSGRTKQGAEAALSHTGGMMGDDSVYSTLFKQYGAIRAEDYSEFLVLLKIFSFKKLPLSKSIFVLSNAGGAGVLLTDKIITNNLELKTISQSLKEQLIKPLDGLKKITIHNPIDLLGDASAFEYERVIKATISEKEIGAIVVLLTPQANTQIKETAQVLTKLQYRFSEPIYPIFMGKVSMSGVGRYFEEEKMVGFANFDYLTSAIKKIIDYKDYLNQGKTEKVISKLNKLSNNWSVNSKKNNNLIISQNNNTDLFQSLSVIKSLGIPTVNSHKIESLKDISTSVKKLIFPVVVKISSSIITHKTEVGGVIINIKNEQELIESYKKLSDISKIVIVQEMVKGYEIIVGAKRDPKFGIIMALGLGGIYTELLKDVSFRIHPFSYKEFEKMVAETKSCLLFKGFRGKKPVDVKKIYKIIRTLGDFMESQKDISEMEINPLIVSDQKISAVDVRIIFIH
ncbi:MAG TPA: acetate--CoA ligase family protein [Patescibacteria group bacterium]